MKTLQKTLLGLTASIALISGANAIDYSNGQAYVGVKAGQFNTKSSIAGTNFKKQTAYGVFGGYQLDPNWGVEAEFLGSDKGDVTIAGTKVGDLKTKSYGVYGTYNYNFATTPVYAKGKLGLVKTEVEAKTAARTVKADDTGLAYGVGVGYQATPALSVEAEYAKPEKDTNLWTIGAKFKF